MLLQECTNTCLPQYCLQVNLTTGHKAGVRFPSSFEGLHHGSTVLSTFYETKPWNCQTHTHAMSFTTQLFVHVFHTLTSRSVLKRIDALQVYARDLQASKEICSLCGSDQIGNLISLLLALHQLYFIQNNSSQDQLSRRCWY